MLTLEIEWLTGIASLAMAPSCAEPDWPPQPDRVFSALVASWGARGDDPQERAALEWLEACPPPRLFHRQGAARQTVSTFVPPNDDTARLTRGRIRVLPAQRSRQPRQFPSVRIDAPPPHMELIWAEAPAPDLLDRLAALAHDTSYLGHSASFVRCRFVLRGEPSRELKPAETVRGPYPGRLAELVDLHQRHERGEERARAGPAHLPVPARGTESPAGRCSIFGERWLVLAHADGPRPDLRAAAVLGRQMRRALMSGMDEPVPAWVSGHTKDGRPLDRPHLAILPLAEVGWPGAEGHMQGLAIVPPRDLDEVSMDATPAGWAERYRLLAVIDVLAEHGRVPLRLGELGIWRLAPDLASDAAALSPSRYTAPARRFATLTPIALDRHPKGDQAARARETVEIIATACERIGLPRPETVAAHKHAALSGAPSARPPRGMRRATDWARPGPLSGRPLTHATLTFAEPVHGPVVLGAGRFSGLGLCLPV